jgi:hypothetical protein
MYAHVAQQIDRILSKDMDKEYTTLHWDGLPSDQKSLERLRRQMEADKELIKLEGEVAEAVTKAKSAPSRLFRTCRRLFRPSESILDDIREELGRLGWRVCRCPYQADTHIAQICKEKGDDDQLEVVSGDSDLLVYEDIHRITMPVGNKHELTTFQKSDILSSLELPSNRHFLLACLLTRNDYYEGIPGLGIKRNAAIVRGFELDPEDPLDIVIDGAIEEYIDSVKNRKWKDVEDIKTDSFKHAVSAFVSLKEDWSPDAAPSAQTCGRISKVLQDLQKHKRMRSRRWSQQQHEHQQHDQSKQLERQQQHDQPQRQQHNRQQHAQHQQRQPLPNDKCDAKKRNKRRRPKNRKKPSSRYVDMNEEYLHSTNPFLAKTYHLPSLSHRKKHSQGGRKRRRKRNKKAKKKREKWRRSR